VGRPSFEPTLYRVAKAILFPGSRLLYRLKVEGVENVPRSGCVILASNHLSFIDSLFIPIVVPRRVTYVAKAEYFDSWKTRYIFQALGQIPIRRGPGAEWRRALDAASEVLEHGGCLGIYPEGTRSRDGRLHRGHTGVARLSLTTGAPIVPTAVLGTDQVQPIGAKLPRVFKPVRVRFGTPLRFSEFAGRENNRGVLRQITDAVMREIQALSGQEYVPNYTPIGRPEDRRPAADPGGETAVS
jgi:1-acyl-sn-glycerol-3-phosphate acyltransferase